MGREQDIKAGGGKAWWYDIGRRPLLLVTIFMVLGIGTARLGGGGGYPGFLWFPAGAGLLLVLGLGLQQKSRALLALAGAMLVFFLAGYLNYFRAVNLPEGDISHFAGSPATVQGIIWGVPRSGDNYQAFDLKVEEIDTFRGRGKASGKVRVSLYGRGEDLFAPGEDSGAGLGYGDRVRVTGQLELPPVQRNPGGFDYRFFLLGQGVSALLKARGEGVVERLGEGEGNWLMARGLGFRGKVTGAIFETLPPGEASLLAGILLGSRDQLSPGLAEDFSRAGLGHLLAVSGLHLGLLVLGVLGLGRLLKLPGKAAWPLALALAFFYLVVTGFKPSTVRAFIMLCLGGGAFFLGREKDSLTAVAAAALPMLLYRPLWLFTISFQLSFAAVLSIVILVPGMVKRSRALPPYLGGLVSLTLAAQLGVMPLLAYYFFEVSPVSFFANLLVVPFMGVVVGLGFAGALSCLAFPGLAQFFFQANYFFLAGLARGAGFLASLPGAFLGVNPPGPVFLFLYYTLLLVAVPGWLAGTPVKGEGPVPRRGGKPGEGGCQRLAVTPWLQGIPGKRPAWSPAYLALALAALLVWLPVFPGSPSLEVYFLDVGQGDAIFINTPGGKNILVDAGGRPAYLQSEEYGSDLIGERVVVPFLRHQGVKKLDLVVLTHPHEDHYGGLLAVLEHFPVELLVTTPAESDFFLFQQLKDKAAEKGIPWKHLVAGYRFSGCQGLVMDFYNPPGWLFRGTGSDLNNNSLVFRLEWEGVTFLFTGDAEGPAENYMVNAGHDLGSLVLKVGHHGSDTSSGEVFLGEVGPRVAVIQVGEGNPYGHPSPGALERLEYQGARVFRNDRDGAVMMSTRGSRLEVKTHVTGEKVQLQLGEQGQVPAGSR